MLRKIHIQNYAIIDQLEIDFHSGMTIITGETGAGKSILLGALGLLMGKRADTKVLYDADRKCYVEGTFDIKTYGLQELLESLDVEYDDELSIRREIAQNGKSRAFINDTPVTLDVLDTLSDSLIDIHQQFDTTDIQKNQYQINVLDALAHCKDEVGHYKTDFKQYKTISKQLEELENQSRNAAQEIEFLQFQLQEFETLNLQEGEQASLESLLQVLEAAEDIKKNTSLVQHGIEEDENAIIGQLQVIYQQFSSIKGFDPIYQSIYDRLISTREELADIAKEAGRISEATDFDPEKILSTQQRLNGIYRLQKKHGVTTDTGLLEVEERLQLKLNGFEDVTTGLQKLQKQKDNLHASLQKQGLVISKARQKATKDIETKVHELLASLSMEHAFIKFDIKQGDTLYAHGIDNISLLFSPNKGSDFLPVKDTASGGELSRLALCVKSLTAGAMTLPTLIFDEIDSGVSGEVANKMGSILGKLSQQHQLICITHSPQVASTADSHYWVYKQDTPTRTITAMRALDSEERITEIAKMLSGNPPSAAAIANAKELIAAKNR